MPGRHHTPYLSPSRLSCYEWCPAEYHRRYVLGIKDPASVEMVFGSAVHAGLEAYFQGTDDELAFLRSWRTLSAELPTLERTATSALSARGLELLAMVRNLDLHGTPEHRISITVDGIKLPFFGFVDLWSEGHIWDFKTSRQTWSQAKADAQIFQPAIYSQAHSESFASIPRFTFVVLPRTPGELQLIDGTRTPAQIIAAFDRAKEILAMIDDNQFACRCGKHVEAAA